MSTPCPNCAFDVPAQMRFCGRCGTRVAQMCPNCGALNPLPYLFCGMCGAALKTEAVDGSVLASPEAVTPVLSLPLPREPAPAPLAGERRVVTVVLTDVSSSTNLLEQLGTEAWVELMNRLLHILEAEVARFGGEVDQFRGDGLVAFFGATMAHEDDPERAVLAALSMQQTLQRFAGDLARRSAIDLHMRVGVNTGEVIVTSAPDRRRRGEETAMGMAVAIAARMEAAAQADTVLVSETTYRLAEPHFEWQSLGEITVKGVSEPLQVYRPLAPKAEADLLHRAETFLPTLPLIGRDAEVQSLKGCVETLFAGRGGIALLTGDRGLGKSFLVNEVRQYFEHRGALLAEMPDSPGLIRTPLTWLRGRCRSYHQTWPYAVWIDLLHDWLGTRQIASKEVVQARLRAEAEALWGEAFAEYYPYLARLLALPLEEPFHEKVRHLDGENLRQRIFLAVRNWVETLVRRGPLVLTFADMQWADESSLNLLRHSLSLCDTEALLYLVVFRPERASPVWEFQHHVETDYPHRLTRIDLLPLDEAQSAELIARLIGPGALPAETSGLIIKTAEGNPYYLLELIDTLMAQGILARAGEAEPWRLTRVVTTLDLPAGLQRLLLARLDRLSPEERFVLQVAAVVGPVFWFNVLEVLIHAEQSLKAHLAALQRAQFILESGRVPKLGMQYAFRSALVRDAAYESLLSAQRATFHLQAAEYLETAAEAESLSDYYGLLAYHYRGADNPRKELFYALLAAEQAHKLYANAEALQYYTRALELVDRMEAALPPELPVRALHSQRFEILRGRRVVLYEMGQLTAAGADSQALLPLAEKMPDDPAWRVDALLAQPELNTWNSREELTRGLHMAEQALALARQLGDQRREMESLVASANIRYRLKDPRGQETAEQALALARQLGDLKTEVNLLLRLGDARGMDDLESNQRYLEAALARSESLNDKATEIALLAALAPQFERQGDYYRQLTEYEEKRLRISREIGHRYLEGMGLMHCGQVRGLYLGDYEAGLRLELEALHVWENVTNRPFPLLRIAQIHTAQGRYDEALAVLERAQPIEGNFLTDLGRAGFGLVTAILYNALGESTTEAAHLRRALEAVAQVRQLVAENLVSRQYHMAAACEAAAAHLGLARVLSDEASRLEQRRQALEASQLALSVYEVFGFVQIVECLSEEILFRHSQALAANGHAAEAAEFVRRAYDEMMRKHALLPPDSLYRTTYLENIALHTDIRAAYQNLVHPETAVER